jgi:hypothetical protein
VEAAAENAPQLLGNFGDYRQLQTGHGRPPQETLPPSIGTILATDEPGGSTCVSHLHHTTSALTARLRVFHALVLSVCTGCRC